MTGISATATTNDDLSRDGVCHYCRAGGLDPDHDRSAWCGYTVCDNCAAREDAHDTWRWADGRYGWTTGDAG